MKVSHFITSLDKSTGGPARSVSSLLTGIGGVQRDLKLNILTFSSENPISLEKISYLNSYYFKSIFTYFVFLLKDRSSIYHVHGLWHLTIMYLSRVALFKNIPYLISPRGMLEPWSLSQNRTKKKLALILYQSNVIKRSRCIHATSQSEAENIRRLGYDNPIAVIPNSLDLNKFTFSSSKRSNKVLFLSRIHPKKGIEVLIAALSMIEVSILQGWKFEIVGNGDETYIKALNRLIVEKYLTGIVEIKGPIFGSEKVLKYQEAKFFVLPSYSENFGVVVAESLACGTPVITTKGTPWKDLELFNCGWWINNDVCSLRDTILHAMLMSDDDIAEMGANGRNLVSQKFCPSIISEKMVKLYEWMISDNCKPDFIV